MSAAAAEPLRALAARDPFAALLGLQLVQAGAGHATVRMQVTERHLNFNGTCHGGAIFALADSAFGLASNSHGVLASGIDTHTVFSRAARAGDNLTAAATEIARSRRLATYRVDVNRGDGKRVAAFTGTVFVTDIRHGPPDDPAIP